MFKKIDILDYTALLNYPNKPLSDDELDKVEDVFYTYLELIFDNTSYIEGFDELFQLQNFFPAFVGKEIGSGKWINRLQCILG